MPAFSVRLLFMMAVLATGLVRAGQAPDFTLPDGEGVERSLSDQRGSVVMINFWASWCAPCREEMPELERIWRDYRDRDFMLWGINLDRSAEVADEFLEEMALSFPILYDPDHEVPDLYEVPGMPTTVLVDRDGTLRHVNHGYRSGDEDKYRQQARALLGQPAPGDQ